MDIEIDIEPLENTLLKRKVVYMGHTHDKDDRFFIIYCSIYYYDNENNLLGANLFDSKSTNEDGTNKYKAGQLVEMLVDNNTIVDANGDSGNEIGEYSFYMGMLNDFETMKNLGINSLSDLLRLGINKAIQRGKFS